MAARSRSIVLAVGIAATLFPAAVFAQGSMDIDGSLRSAAMGGASNALFRGGSVNHWGNPALLAQLTTLRYEHHRSQLVPGLASDVWNTGNYTMIGAGGVGVVFGGDPVGPDGSSLDFGVPLGGDGSGSPIGVRGFERVRSWGFGVSLLEALESLMRLPDGKSLTVQRYVDVSVGTNVKHVDIDFGGAKASLDERDAGMLVRVTPVDGIGARRGPPVRVDASYGYSVLNYTDDVAVFLAQDLASVPTRHHRHGMALTLAAGATGNEIVSPFWRTVVRGFTPLVAVSGAFERDDLGAGDRIDYETEGSGFEIAIANVCTYRRGHYRDRVGDIDGDTRGFSFGLPIGPFGGYAYEEAWIPQARGSGLRDVHRKGYAVWIDPFAIARSLNGRGHESSASRTHPSRPPSLATR